MSRRGSGFSSVNTKPTLGTRCDSCTVLTWMCSLCHCPSPSTGNKRSSNGRWVSLAARLSRTQSCKAAGKIRSRGSLRPPIAALANSPGRPKQWSPCTWVMKMPRRSRTESELCSSWCCVPSPQSTRYQCLPLASMTAVALTLRALVGTPEEVPRNCRSNALLHAWGSHTLDGLLQGVDAQGSAGVSCRQISLLVS